MVLAVVTMCQEYHCLPDAGGLLDQDPFWVEAMQVVIAAQADKAAKEKAK